jgi:hypothetical protein
VPTQLTIGILDDWSTSKWAVLVALFLCAHVLTYLRLRHAAAAGPRSGARDAPSWSQRAGATARYGRIRHHDALCLYVERPALVRAPARWL